MVEGTNVEVRPTVDHSEEGKMGVGFCFYLCGIGRGFTEAELVEYVLREEDWMVGCVAALAVTSTENLLPSCVNAIPETTVIGIEHEFEYLGCAAGVLVDKRAGRGVEDGEACIDVPFVGVYAKHDVDFYGFDAANVIAVFPGVREGI